MTSTAIQSHDESTFTGIPPTEPIRHARPNIVPPGLLRPTLPDDPWWAGAVRPSSLTPLLRWIGSRARNDREGNDRAPAESSGPGYPPFHAGAPAGPGQTPTPATPR